MLADTGASTQRPDSNACPICEKRQSPSGFIGKLIATRKNETRSRRRRTAMYYSAVVEDGGMYSGCRELIDE